jgi:FtsH-binding integral membrane protein
VPPQRSIRLPRPNWSQIAAACAASLVASILFALLVGASGPNDFWILMMLLSGFVGLVATPLALYFALKQLKANPGKQRGRNLAAAALLTYAAITPILLLIVAEISTEGLIIYPLGFLAFVYAQYKLIQHLRHHTIAALPADPPTPPTTNPLWTTAPGNHAAAV